MCAEVHLTPLAREGDVDSMFLLDRASGSYSRVAQEKPFQHGARGLALEWRVGLFRQHTILLALIADNETLWLRVGADEFDLRNPEIRVHKSDALPFVRIFEVWRSDVRCVKHVYWAYTQGGWSPFDDLPGFIAEISRDEQELLRTMIRFRAAGERRDILDANVLRDIERESGGVRGDGHGNIEVLPSRRSP